MNNKTRPLLRMALELFKKKRISPGIAIDFGIGRGNETAYLLKEGYRVISVDNFDDFLTDLVQRVDVVPYHDKLTIMHSDFENLEWDTIPSVDLFLALYALCYVQKNSFYKVVSNILKKIKPGGYFVGQLYTSLVTNKQVGGYFIEEAKHGDNYGLVYEPFMTKEDIMGLFKDFTLEYFEDADLLYEEENKSSQETLIHSIIARKKCSN